MTPTYSLFLSNTKDRILLVCYKAAIVVIEQIVKVLLFLIKISDSITRYSDKGK
jgi:hypothetical protein